MDFFKKVVSSAVGGITGGGLAPGFPYLADELLVAGEGGSSGGGGLWTIHKGHNVSFKKDDPAGAVTIFTCDLTKSKHSSFARNAFRRLKMLRHPRILKLIEGVEVDGKLHFATEPVVPFAKKQAEIGEGEDWAMWTLFSLLESLRFLNEEAQIVHGNVRPSALFVAPSGEVKLAGFELASSQAEMGSGSSLLDSRKMGSLYETDSWPPELQSSHRTIASYAGQSWMFAKFVKDLLGNRIPRPLQAFCASALAKDPSSRHSPALLLEASQSQVLFGSQLIECDRGLSQLILASAAEQEAFFLRTLARLGDLPQAFLVHKLLPSVIGLNQSGIAGGQLNSLEGMRLVLRAGLLLPPEAFEALIEPFYVALFERPDRAVRLLLLESLDGELLQRLSRRVIQEKVFAHFVTGFADAMPELRERTLKASILLIPCLSTRQVNNDLLRHYAKLQADEQPGIRVNTIICMGKMVGHFEASTKRKAFSAAIARALQDPFPPAKAAGLQTLLASLDAFEAEQLARMILPTVCTLLVDPDLATRRQAFAAVRSILERIEACNAEADKARGDEPKAESPSQQQHQQHWWGLERLTSQVSSVQEKYLGKAKPEKVMPRKVEEVQANTLQPANKSAPLQPMAKASPLQSTTRTPPQLPTQSHAPAKTSKPMKLSRPVQEGWEEDELNIPSINDSPKPPKATTPSPQNPFEEDNIIAGLNLDNDWASEKDPWA